MTTKLRQALNAIAHKRAREVARAKRAPPAKVGTAIKAEFISDRRRIP